MSHTLQQLVWNKGLHLKVPHTSAMICREIFEICIIKLNKVIKECKSKKFNMSHKLVCFKRSTLFILYSCLCYVTGRFLQNLIRFLSAWKKFDSQVMFWGMLEHSFQKTGVYVEGRLAVLRIIQVVPLCLQYAELQLPHQTLGAEQKSFASNLQ